MTGGWNGNDLYSLLTPLRRRAAGKAGQTEHHEFLMSVVLLDSPVWAPEVVHWFRTARKRNASVWGNEPTRRFCWGRESKPRPHGAGIDQNSTTKIIGQQPGRL